MGDGQFPGLHQTKQRCPARPCTIDNYPLLPMKKGVFLKGWGGYDQINYILIESWNINQLFKAVIIHDINQSPALPTVSTLYCS